MHLMHGDVQLVHPEAGKAQQFTHALQTGRPVPQFFLGEAFQHIAAEGHPVEGAEHVHASQSLGHRSDSGAHWQPLKF